MNLRFEYTAGFLMRLLDAVAGFATIVAITQLTSASFLGSYFVLVSVVQFVASPVGGYSSSIIFYGRKKNLKSSTIYSTGIFTALVYSLSSGVVLLSVFTIFGFYTRFAAVACFLLLVSESLFSLSTSVYKINGTPAKAKGIDVVRGILSAAAKILFLIFIEKSFEGIIVVSSVVTFLAVAYVIVSSRANLARPSTQSLVKTLNFGRWTTVSDILTTTRNQSQAILIRFFTGDAIVGYYESAKRVSMPVSYVSRTISEVIFVSRSGSNKESIEADEYAAVFAIALLFGALAIGEETLSLFFGSAFGDYWWVLVMISVIRIVDAYQSVLSSEITGDGAPRYQTYSAAVSSIVFIVTSTALWFSFGFLGIVSGIVFSSIAEFASTEFFYREEFNGFYMPSRVRYQFFSAALMGITVEWLSADYRVGVMTLILIIVGTALYVTVLSLFDTKIRNYLLSYVRNQD